MNKALFIGGSGNVSTSAIRKVLERNLMVGIFTLPASPTARLEAIAEQGFQYMLISTTAPAAAEPMGDDRAIGKSFKLRYSADAFVNDMGEAWASCAAGPAA